MSNETTVPLRWAAAIASVTTAGVVSDRAAKIPPVCSQRAPSTAKMASQSTSPGLSCDAAVFARSELPTAARTPKPRSVKLRPLRTVRPIPSYGTQLTCERSTPPCRIRSSISRPTGLSANAVTIVVSAPKQRLRPRATLYSPPPSQAWNRRVVWIRASPGSRRSITSPSATRSQRDSDRGRRVSVIRRDLPADRLDGRSRLSGQPADLSPVSSGKVRRANHPTATNSQDRGHSEVFLQVGRFDPTGRHETHRRERAGKGPQVGRTAGRGGREQLDCREAEVHRPDHLGRREDSRQYGDAPVLTRPHDLDLQTGADDEHRAGGHGRIKLGG